MYSVFKKILFSLHPELAHELVKSVAPVFPKALFSRLTTTHSSRLTTHLGTTPLSNPIGLAAGFDKNAELVQFMSSLGFGFLELGSVTAKACAGNSKPRIFRLPEDVSLINRMGLPNHGAKAFAQKLANQKTEIPIGINISKTPDFAQDVPPLDAVEDYLTTFLEVRHLGDYIVFNLSCPNSGDSKLLEHPDLFQPLAKAIDAERKLHKVKKPLFLKISPDLDLKNLKTLLEIAYEYDFDGFVLTNTTTQRPLRNTSQKRILEIGRGGLSGKALTELANRQLKAVTEIVEKKKTIIGVGGIMTFDDLLTKLSLGATHFQIYTGLIYGGPFFVRDLNRQLDEYCAKVGVKNYQELVGHKIE